MKLLFDENLSPKLTAAFASAFPGSMHVRDCGLKGQTDSAIWSYAAAHGFAIVSKDIDFYQRSLLIGAPPKFIWLRIGNCTRTDVIRLITGNEAAIKSFDQDTARSILIIT
ncbi:hypothetical protein OpiT1DRAFT_02156 [Opitutaceae bacterium TAV1]|nr:hypothetical protein OpiT1DRAFT_02156 [Opitutaceae bacterium TAV1]